MVYWEQYPLLRSGRGRSNYRITRYEVKEVRAQRSCAGFHRRVPGGGADRAEDEVPPGGADVNADNKHSTNQQMRKKTTTLALHCKPIGIVNL